MTGLLSRIEDLVAGVTPSWTATHVIARGTPRYPDKPLRGTLRYAHRVGSFLPNIQAENRMALADTIHPDSPLIPLDRIVDGLMPGSLLMVDGKELHAVADVNYYSTSVSTVFGIQTTHAAGVPVDLFGEPYRVIGPVHRLLDQTTQLVVRGRFQVILGDKIWVQSAPNLLLSGTDYEVIALQGYQQSMTEWDTVVVVRGALPGATTGDSVVYLRAFPNYQSKPVYVPQVNRVPYPLGPFVVDYLSGQMNDQPDPREVFSLQTFDNIGVPYETYPVRAGKNVPIVRCAIHQSSFLWWHPYAGTVNYRNDKLVIKCDDRGEAYLWVDLVPGWVGPAAWRARVRWLSGSPMTLNYRFFPDDLRQAGFGVGGEYSTAVFKLYGDATRAALTVTGTPGSELEMDAWTVYALPATQTDPEFRGEVARVQYALMCETVGHQGWQAGSIQLKPYFRTLADLRTQMDTGVRLDSGTLIL